MDETSDAGAAEQPEDGIPAWIAEAMRTEAQQAPCERLGRF